MIPGYVPDLSLGFEHFFYILVRDTVEKSGVPGFMIRDKCICLLKIIFCITAAGMVYPLSFIVGDIPEDTPNGLRILVS